jgi:TDG/mug DNA glycosylase family protein
VSAFFFTKLLPEYLAPNLEIIFIGLNPGTFSDRQGHYFARPTNLFWTALYESGLVADRLRPEDDTRMIEFGYGLTDLVPRVTPNIDSLTRDEYIAGGKALRARIEPLTPRIACFVGITGYRAAFDPRAVPGAQSSPGWGRTKLFIVPSTSPRNTYYRPQVIEWFKKLKEFHTALAGA